MVEPQRQIKLANCLPEVQSFINTLTPDPRYTYVLTNAMGNSWWYGSNSNADWYGFNPHLEFDGLIHSWPELGQSPEADRMKGKAWPYGYPSFYGATAFAHHKNTNPQQLGFGDVVFLTYNPTMKRVELVIRVFNEEAERKGQTSILDRIRSGERQDVSMGAKIPFDLDSIDTDWDLVKKAWGTYDPLKHRHPGIAILEYHKNVKPIRGLSVTMKDYSPAFLRNKNRIYPDGRRHFVYNDFPRFFDISFVWIGADRTARVMWHMTGEEAAPAPKLAAKAYIPKRASMEKEIPGGIASAVDKDSRAARPILAMRIMASGVLPKVLLSTLARLGIVASPREFADIGFESNPDTLAPLDKVSFDLSLPEIDSSLAVDPSLVDHEWAEKLSTLMEARSSFGPFLKQRLKHSAADRGSLPVMRSAELDKIAAAYNGYRLSILESAPSLFPGALAYTSPDLLLKTASEPELLLGPEPVLQLLSSHLRCTEAGLSPMIKLASTRPSLDGLTQIGSAIRLTMDREKVGYVEAVYRLMGEA